MTTEPQFYCKSSESMPELADAEIALTVTSPPYWNAIDYDIHAAEGNGKWYRTRGGNDSIEAYKDKMRRIFGEVMRVTMPGGFCAVVVGTILHRGKHYPLPHMLTTMMIESGWEFHQDIIWNKVTGGIKRAGSFIQHRKAGYYYPNIMTEHILVFRKEGKKRYGKEKEIPIDEVFTRDIANNIWHIAPIPPNTIDHPCPFPEELARRLILLYSQKGDTTLDPFLGSGQTAKVALALQRKAVGYDIEKKYIELATKRLSQPDPRTHQLLSRFEKIPAQTPR